MTNLLNIEDITLEEDKKNFAIHAKYKNKKWIKFDIYYPYFKYVAFAIQDKNKDEIWIDYVKAKQNFRDEELQTFKVTRGRTVETNNTQDQGMRLARDFFGKFYINQLIYEFEFEILSEIFQAICEHFISMLNAEKSLAIHSMSALKKQNYYDIVPRTKLYLERYYKGGFKATKTTKHVYNFLSNCEMVNQDPDTLQFTCKHTLYNNNCKILQSLQESLIDTQLAWKVCNQHNDEYQFYQKHIDYHLFIHNN